MQKVIFSENLKADILAAYNACEHDKTFVLCDTVTERCCLPLIADILNSAGVDYQLITIPAGDDNKTLESLQIVWQAMSQGGATRHSLLINVAGGMVTDLGGFAAAAFKRGINFVNIPTTLLAQVDASVGGKTGVNFCGYKNEIGAFCDANTVIISSLFLRSLDDENLLSGYAEMLKHSLLSDGKMLNEHLNFDFTAIDYDALQRMVAQSVAVKQRVVEEDPRENGIRKALNLGHTIGHAFESWAMRHADRLERDGRPMLHGFAVAYGLVCELFLSSVICGFPSERLHQVARFVKDNYGSLPLTCDDYPELVELMSHDKKNQSGIINFTLLSDVGAIEINQTATRKEIEDALDYLIF